MSVLELMGVMLALWWGTLAAFQVYALNVGTRIRLNAQLQALVARSGVKRVVIRRRRLSSLNRRALAMATYNLGRHVIYLDERFLILCDLEQLQFVLGHELGHHKLGHCRDFALRVALGAELLRLVQPYRGLKLLSEIDEELAADRYAEELTGITRHVLDYGPVSAYFRGMSE